MNALPDMESYLEEALQAEKEISARSAREVKLTADRVVSLLATVIDLEARLVGRLVPVGGFHIRAFEEIRRQWRKAPREIGEHAPILAVALALLDTYADTIDRLSGDGA